ncbi:potassium transporter, partial [Pseudoalteromonas sp. S1688]
KDALAGAIRLWQMGEFVFVLIALAAQHNLLSVEQVAFLFAMCVISMELTQYLIDKTTFILKRLGMLEREKFAFEEELQSRTIYHNHVVICGFSRV